MHRLSPSAIQLLECPYRFFTTRLWEHPVVERTSRIALLGRYIHEILDAYYKHCKKAGLSSDFDHLPIIEAELIAEASWRYEIADEAHEVTDKYIRANLVDVEAVLDAEREYAFTREWKECKWDAPDCFIRGRTDRQDVVGDAIIKAIDYKTGWAMKDAKATMQLGMYALFASLIYPGFSEYHGCIEYVRFGKRVERSFTLPELEIIKEQIIKISDELETKIEWHKSKYGSIGERLKGERLDDVLQMWPAKPCDGCSYCGLDCPLVKQMGAVAPIQSQEAAEQYANETLALEGALNARMLMLEIWTADNGEIITPGGKFGWRHTETIEYPEDKARAICRDLGVPDDQYLRLVTQGDLKKLAKKYPELSASLETIATPKTGESRFGKRIK